ncbi:phage antirepressor protein KilAC domain-containing protein [Rhodococcus sp. OK611]|uniref:phage antirepressor n=1 Tax=unclassified Rhodococcus (in: high G+C Gram-positive bacteria) TaxID=192944 RepID=UPI000BCA406F|nr:MULTISPECIES: phage antirepressor [unclassified Rhodococcus (in: high G+C Gram-positive bacteria)]PTR42070.1 phage antirepressor protein KilAC domain-containing protein [Rhodococcus sp. OK611]SNX91483.1 Phage antirepressor protein KilAC domain-containing protein [Rhodococcus sp. OK270]
MPNSTAELVPFQYESASVRVLTLGDEPWFVLADLARVLDIKDVSRLASRLDDGVRQTHPIADSLGRTQQATIVNEPGMYEVVIRSDKPEALAFRRWITTEVLPSIRRTGAYGVPALNLTALGPTERAYLTQMSQGLQLALESAERNQTKADAFDAFLNGKGCYLIDTVANLIGARHKPLWRLLYDEKVLIESGPRRRQPYAKPKLAGWFSVKTHDQSKTNGHASHTTYATPYGAEQIRLLAIERGLIEPQLMALPGSSALAVQG